MPINYELEQLPVIHAKRLHADVVAPRSAASVAVLQAVLLLALLSDGAPLAIVAGGLTLALISLDFDLSIGALATRWSLRVRREPAKRPGSAIPQAIMPERRAG